MNLDQEVLKKALRKIGMNLETHGLLAPSDFTNEDVTLLYSLGFNLYQMSDYEAAKDLFQRLVLSRPYEKKFWLGLGACLQMSKNYEEALNAWSMASLIDDEDALPHFHAAECLFCIEKKEEAFIALESAKARVKQDQVDLVEKINHLNSSWIKKR